MGPIRLEPRNYNIFVILQTFHKGKIIISGVLWNPMWLHFCQLQYANSRIAVCSKAALVPPNGCFSQCSTGNKVMQPLVQQVAGSTKMWSPPVSFSCSTKTQIFGRTGCQTGSVDIFEEDKKGGQKQLRGSFLRVFISSAQLLISVVQPRTCCLTAGGVTD